MDIWDLIFLVWVIMAFYCCVPAGFILWVQNCDTTLYCLSQKAVTLSTVLLQMSKWYWHVMLLMCWWMWDLLGAHLVRPYAFIVSVHIFCSIDRTNGLISVVMQSILNLFPVLCTGNSVSLFKCWHFYRLLPHAHLRCNRTDPLPPSSVHVIICLFIQQFGILLF